MKFSYRVEGMTCPHCEAKVENCAKAFPGVTCAKASFRNSRLTIESELPIAEADLKNAIEEAGYSLVLTPPKHQRDYSVFYILAIVFGLFIIANRLDLFAFFRAFPVVSEAGTTYPLLFLIGLFTSVHCVSMCGGIYLGVNSIGETVNPIRRAFFYHSGRIISYTLVGGFLGAIGNAVSISLKVRGTIGLLAGLWMLIMGVNLFGNFGILRKFQVHLSAGVARKIHKATKHSPFFLGIANGFMPCGPLQAMQIYAIASGSFFAGAFSMFCFALGTSPLLFAFGAAAGFLRKNLQNIVLKISACLLLFLGFFMVQNDLALAGIDLPDIALPGSASNSAHFVEATFDGHQQVITTTLGTGKYTDIKLKNNVPVRWNIVAHPDSLNGCNNEIVLPAFDKKIMLKPGDNIIEFTPKDAGDFIYTCWMGMIKNHIRVE